ncbi:MAG: class IV adenylate cyclase [Solirubrobacteraceae bacterium]
MPPWLEWPPHHGSPCAPQPNGTETQPDATAVPSPLAVAAEQDGHPPRRNLELKAIDPDPARSLEVCRGLRATDAGEVVQRDTYFHVLHGGLKLREETPGGAHLIQFERSETAAPTESRYRIIAIVDAAACCAALSTALGVGAVVVKRRRVFLSKNLRIHLDDVDGLGTFVELEAVAAPGVSVEADRASIEELRAAFGITDAHLVADGYARLLTRNPGAAAVQRRSLSARRSG